jgi:hypothetical protein
VLAHNWQKKSISKLVSTLESLLNVNDIYKVNIYEIEHFRWRYVHMIDILEIPMLQLLAM